MKYIVVNNKFYSLEGVKHIYEKSANPACPSSSRIYLIIRYTDETELSIDCDCGYQGIIKYNEVLEDICKKLSGGK